ncbi:MAG: hypothetical protein EB084_07950 [Proteobacteria bacterium]|nr:hypothetical protein [Pseudomonadota bacterium]
MPCTFSCAATIERVGALRADIERLEPTLVAAIDRHTRMPALVLRERKLYFFEGEAQANRIDYTRWMYEGSDAAGNVLAPWLEEGDAVEVDGLRVRVLRGGRELGSVVCRDTGFAPEVPFVARFDAT